MATRYRLVQPLAQLARSNDATSGELTRLAELARRDPEWPVRMRAVELSAGIAPLLPTVVAALSTLRSHGFPSLVYDHARVASGW